MGGEEHASRLFELADLTLVISRHVHASKEFAFHSWTPAESTVMRYVDRNPGTSASAAAEAIQLMSSNFSRVLRGLERKGLVRRDIDRADTRRVRLYPSKLAHENLQLLRDVWGRLLGGIIDDPDDIDRVNATLRRIEAALIVRARHDTWPSE